MSRLLRGALIVKHNAHPKQTAERVAAKLSERGVAKVHPASKFAGADPPDEVADALGDLASGRAKNINEAGPLTKEGALTGVPADVAGQGDIATRHKFTRQNEAAQTVSNTGYKIEQLPEYNALGVKNPDYRINGNSFDCYTPNAETSARNVWSAIKGKIDSGQTNRVVLNLDDSGLSLDDLRAQFRDWEVPNLHDLIVVKDGHVIPFWEFLH